MLNRSNNMTIQQIKEEIEKLKGKRINMSVNQGRKKFVNFEGVIQDTYSSIFVVRLLESTKNVGVKNSENHIMVKNTENQFDIKFGEQQVCAEEMLESSKNNSIEMTQREPIDNEVKYDCPPIIEIPNNNNIDLRTYSYIDILCGNVDIKGFMS